MKPSYLQYLMKDANLTQARVAAELGVSTAMVSYVVNGCERSGRIEVYIAKKLGMDVDDIWPLDISAPMAA